MVHNRSYGSGVWSHPMRQSLILMAMVLLALLAFVTTAFAHAVTEGDKGYIQEVSGMKLIPFMYLGAKHVAICVSLFAIGHSTTMLAGVYFGWNFSSYLIDAIIGLSVVYKALDNLGAYQRWFGVQPDTKAATLIFGFFHGLGLATKLLEYDVAPNGLIPNLLAFNVGVEIGQLIALAMILIVMGYWRKTTSFWKHAYTANVVMMSAGFILIGYQMTGYFVA